MAIGRMRLGVVGERRASALGQSDTEGEVLDSRSLTLLHMWTGALESRARGYFPPRRSLAYQSFAEFAGRRHAAQDCS